MSIWNFLKKRPSRDELANELAKETLKTLGNTAAKGITEEPVKPPEPREPNWDSLSPCGYLATWDISRQNKQAYRRYLVNRLAHYFFLATGGTYGPNYITIRPVLASDLGLKDWKVPASPTNDDIPWVSHFLPSNTMLALYKFVIASSDPHVNELIFGYNYATRVKVDLTELHSVLPLIKSKKITELMEIYGDIYNIRMEAYFNDPIIYNPGSSIRVSTKRTVMSEDDVIYLGGYVIELKGTTVM
jgi:hypothetical protein